MCSRAETDCTSYSATCDGVENSSELELALRRTLRQKLLDIVLSPNPSFVSSIFTWCPLFPWSFFVKVRFLGRKKPAETDVAEIQDFGSTHFRVVLTYSAIALACSSVSPEIPLLCGALLEGSPFVIWSAI